MKCSFCNNDVEKLKKKNPPACSKCYDKYLRPQAICSICEKKGIIKQKIDNKPICGTCYNKKYKQPKQLCSSCGKMANIVKETICKKCYRKQYIPPTHICTYCGKNKPICNKELEICHSCYKKYFKQVRICECGTKFTAYFNAKLCYKCGVKKGIYKEQEKDFCSICGEFRTINKKEDKICKRCYMKTYKRKKDFCICCKKLKEVHKVYDNGYVCDACYRKKKYYDDVSYKIRTLIRSRINKLVRNGYSIKYKEIIEHLGPCPGPDYHIDHIFPLCAFDLTNPYHMEKAFAPKNHQWLKAKDNLSKGGSFNTNEFDIYMRKK